MMKSVITKTLMGGMCLSLVACAQPEIPQDHYYRLQVAAPSVGPTQLNGVVEVERFRADGLISGRPIVYTEGEGHLSQYHYHFWVEAPVDLLQSQMVKYLRNSDIARHVVTPQLRMDEDYLLTGKIKRLERDVRDEPRVFVELEIGLKRTSTDDILVLKNYSRSAKQISDGVNGAVIAINAVVSDIFAEFLRDVR